jgi:hypothetical protein
MSHSCGDIAFLQFPACEIFPSTASAQTDSVVEEFPNYTQGHSGFALP